MGVSGRSWASPPPGHITCGYAGGLSPANITYQLTRITQVRPRPLCHIPFLVRTFHLRPPGPPRPPHTPTFLLSDRSRQRARCGLTWRRGYAAGCPTARTSSTSRNAFRASSRYCPTAANTPACASLPLLHRAASTTRYDSRRRSNLVSRRTQRVARWRAGERHVMLNRSRGMARTACRRRQGQRNAAVREGLRALDK